MSSELEINCWKLPGNEDKSGGVVVSSVVDLMDGDGEVTVVADVTSFSLRG